MSSPLPPVPGETPEQRQARFAAAAAVQNRIDQQARDEEARRAVEITAAMPQPVAMPLTLNNVPMRNVANPQSHISDYIATMNAPASPAQATAFDRNAGLQQLNTEFGRLRNEYGDDALRGVGFTPSVLQGLQSTMRGLQLDNSSTQDQHNAAMRQVMATLSGYANQLKPVDVVPKRPAELPSVELPSVKPGGANAEEGIPLWMQLGPGPERDAAYAQFMKTQGASAPAQPKFIGQNFTGDAPPPGMKYIETGEGLVPVPINDVYVKPATGPGIGASLGSLTGVAKPQSHISDFIANMNALAAEQKPDIVQMLGKYNLGAAPGTLGGTLGGIGLQSVDAPAPTTPPAALPPANPVNTDDFIPRNVRSPMTVMDTLNLARTLGTAPQQPVQTQPMSQPMPQPTPVQPVPYGGAQGMYRGGFAVR